MKRQIVAALVAVLFAWAPAHAQSEKPVVIKGGHQQVIPSGDTLDLSANPLNTNITGAAIQCVQASTTGVLSGTGASCGGGGGGGTVTTTGTPALGNLTKFSGATSITNGDLSGDCTTSGSLATICLKTNGVSFGTFATQNYATPPAIGATTPAAGSFTTLSASGNLTTNVTGSTQCLHASSLGVVSGTGSDCGSGGASGNWTKIATASPSGTNTVTFGSLGSHRHLRIVGIARSALAGTGSDALAMSFNSDTTSGNYIRQFFAANGSTGSPSQGQGTTDPGVYIAQPPTAGDLANFGQSFEADVMFYSQTTFFKTTFFHYYGVSGASNTPLFDQYGSTYWKSAAAITSLTLTMSGNFVAGSLIDVYAMD